MSEVSTLIPQLLKKYQPASININTNCLLWSEMVDFNINDFQLENHVESISPKTTTSPQSWPIKIKRRKSLQLTSGLWTL